MAKFDAKSFNPQAFGYMAGRVPNLKMNEIKKSRALSGNPDIRNVFSAQNGTAYARLAMRGLLDGDAVNYDGKTDITATSTRTYERGVVVVGRAKAWTEKDFSFDITGGVDFMANIAQQVAEYKDSLDENTILAVLEGIFAMTGTVNKKFVDAHTTIIQGNMTATTLNSATQKACGANKKKFSLVFCHSAVATNLENLNLLEHLKCTDKNGVQRSLDLAEWNGKLVVIDDDLPAKSVPASGSGDTAVPAHTEYTTFVLGNGAIDYEDVGVKVPYEMSRNPGKNGGEDTLYMRQRKVFAPFGISYEKVNQASNSPTDAELKKGANWTLVHSGETAEADRSYIDHRAIPIAKIVSWG